MSLQNVTKVYIAVGSLFVFSICVLNAFYVLNYIKRKFESTNSLEDAVNDKVGLFFFVAVRLRELLMVSIGVVKNTCSAE